MWSILLDFQTEMSKCLQKTEQKNYNKLALFFSHATITDFLFIKSISFFLFFFFFSSLFLSLSPPSLLSLRFSVMWVGVHKIACFFLLLIRRWKISLQIFSLFLQWKTKNHFASLETISSSKLLMLLASESSHCWPSLDGSYTMRFFCNCCDDQYT